VSVYNLSIWKVKEFASKLIEFILFFEPTEISDNLIGWVNFSAIIALRVSLVLF